MLEAGGLQHGRIEHGGADGELAKGLRTQRGSDYDFFQRGVGRAGGRPGREGREQQRAHEGESPETSLVTY